MTVADYIVLRLSEHVQHVYTVYGSASAPIVDSLGRAEDGTEWIEKGKIRYIAVMHEQGGGFAAEIYSKISERGMGCLLTTSGPGILNAMCSIANCWYDSVACLFISGQINLKFMRNDPAIRQVGFQETPIVDIAKPITKYAMMLTDAKNVRYELEKCIAISKEGRPGPVLFDVPMNIQREVVEIDDLKPYISFKKGWNQEHVDEGVHSFFNDIEKCERPGMLIGGGIRSATEELTELSNILRIPMFPTWNAVDVVCDDNPYFCGKAGTFGGKGFNFGIQNLQTLLCAGTRLSGRITGGNIKSFCRGARRYVIDVDEALLQPQLQQLPFDVNILCDIKVFLKRMIQVAKEINYKPRHNAWLGQCRHWKDKYDPVKPEFFNETLNPYAFIRMLSQKMKSGDNITVDCGGNAVIVSGHAFETKTGQRLMSNHGNSPMGFSFPTVLAAFAAKPKSNFVVITGDGGMNMNIQEMASLYNYRHEFPTPPKIIILNNFCYGITKAFQKVNFPGRPRFYDCDASGGYIPPDFIKISQAYGIRTISINNIKDASAQIDELLAANEPVLCNVEIPDYHTYAPRLVGWSTPIEQMQIEPPLSKKEFLDNMYIDPIEGWETFTKFSN